MEVLESVLFEEFKIRDIRLRNRVVVSPMCQYSSEDGFAGDWHLVHLGSRAVGGAALVITEATAVEPRGRISPHDLGIWKDDHIPFLKRITTFVESQGAFTGIQLAHAGRKASTRRPWESGSKVLTQKEGGWTPVAPSFLPFAQEHPVPHPLSKPELQEISEAFKEAARRALEAGFRVVEIHSAHGYLLHEFLSPLSNHRQDEYGGSLENRIRFPLQVIKEVRQIWPEKYPLFVRISATDWLKDGWDADQSVEFAKKMRENGVDIVVCSSGGISPDSSVKPEPSYQVPFAARIRKEAEIATGAVGMITKPDQAEQILREGKADLIVMARELLRNPYWPLQASRSLSIESDLWPKQYLRAKL